MLIPLQDVLKKYSLKIKGVIQVGAHWAEEHEVYKSMGVENIVYVEPCAAAFREMMTRIGDGDLWEGTLTQPCFYHTANVRCFNYACGESEGAAVMHVSHNNQGQSNSLLAPKLHLQQHPEVRFTDAEVVNVLPLDKLPFERANFNLLMLDVQGFELQVLKGAKETLEHIDMVYSEVNSDETYEGNALIGDLDLYLAGFGFKRVITKWPSPNWTWGDAVWLKQHIW